MFGNVFDDFRERLALSIKSEHSEAIRKEDAGDTRFLDEIFTDAQALFSFVRKELFEIKECCIVSIDTNALLLPYKMGNKYFSQIIRIYEQLGASGRLRITGQVAREYTKNRSRNLGDIFKYISQQRSLSAPLGNHISLLQDNNSYIEALAIADEIGSLIKRMKSKLDEVDDYLKGVDGDPIFNAYRPVFHSCIVDHSFDDASKNEFIKNLKRRYEIKRPPGYKDQGKDDAGYGDLLIWMTLINLPDINKKDLLFVTGEEKPDWFVREGGPFHVRPELVEEFRLASDGGSVHIISLPQFLKLFEAGSEVIDDATRAQRETATEKNKEIFLKQELDAEINRLEARIQFSRMQIDEIDQIYGTGLPTDSAPAQVRAAVVTAMQEAFTHYVP